MLEEKILKLQVFESTAQRRILGDRREVSHEIEKQSVHKADIHASIYLSIYLSMALQPFCWALAAFFSVS
jgi:hypothetical protein